MEKNVSRRGGLPRLQGGWGGLLLLRKLCRAVRAVASRVRQARLRAHQESSVSLHAVPFSMNRVRGCTTIALERRISTVVIPDPVAPTVVPYSFRGTDCCGRFVHVRACTGSTPSVGALSLLVPPSGV